MNTQPGKKEGVIWTKEEKIKDLGELAELIMARHGGTIIAELQDIENRVAQVCNKYGIKHPNLDDENECLALRDKARILIGDLESKPDHG